MYRINELIKFDQKLFHTNDLALLWGISDRHNLYMTITRYIDRGILFPLHKGLYATVPVDSLDPLAVARAVIHRYTYLTTESVLAQAGVIFQSVNDFTFVTDRSKRVTIGPWSFRFRQLKPEYLYNPLGVHDQDGNFIASAERAVADILYFNPLYHFDLPESIDFARVNEIQQALGYPDVRSQA